MKRADERCGDDLALDVPCDALPSYWGREGQRHREVLGGNRAEQWAFGPSASQWIPAMLVVVVL